MQIFTKSPDNKQLNFGIFFEVDENDNDNEILSNMGFGDGILQHLENDQYLDTRKPFSLNPVIYLINHKILFILIYIIIDILVNILAISI